MEEKKNKKEESLTLIHVTSWARKYINTSGSRDVNESNRKESKNI
jgi:hypothetical protein